MIPFLIGVAVSAAGAIILSDDKPKTEKTTTRQISSSLVAEYLSPEEMRRIEGSSDEDAAQTLYNKAQDYCYGWNGQRKDEVEARDLYYRAAELGHRGAKIQLKNLWGIDVSDENVAQTLYNKAQDYCYGWNGQRKDEVEARDLYYRAAELGHRGAKIQLKNLWDIDVF